jgi:chloride channel protein, CIC family
MAAQDPQAVPATLLHPRAWKFWLAVLLTGFAVGFSAGLLTKLLENIQRIAWGGSGRDILSAATQAGPLRHVAVLAIAGGLTGLGQVLLRRLSSGNGIDTSAAIWFYAGRLPVLRTLGSAVLSVVDVALGSSLGREGAPKQAGAVFANLFSDGGNLSDEQRRLLVACGAGAGMAAAYGVPLGGALFALEVMRGVLALRFVLPALICSVVATQVAWLFLPDAPTYSVIPDQSPQAILVWCLIAGPIAGVFAVGYVRLITWAERNKPANWRRVIAPAVALTLLGLVSIRFPELLGNGKDVSQLAFSGTLLPALAIILLVLKPLATALCVGSGTPGGLFTPSLTAGAMLGTALGAAWTYQWPGIPAAIFPVLGAGAVLAATTQGPISSVVLIMELTGGDRAFILPLLLVSSLATLTSRTIEIRSIYDARLNDDELEARQRLREENPGTRSLN